MVLVNKYEKNIIAKELPEAHIRRTMKDRSHRHRYYCEESTAAMDLLRKIRHPETR